MAMTALKRPSVRTHYRAEKASFREAVVQNGAFGESIGLCPLGVCLQKMNLRKAFRLVKNCCRPFLCVWKIAFLWSETELAAQRLMSHDMSLGCPGSFSAPKELLAAQRMHHNVQSPMPNL